MRFKASQDVKTEKIIQVTKQNLMLFVHKFLRWSGPEEILIIDKIFKSIWIEMKAGTKKQRKTL